MLSLGQKVIAFGSLLFISGISFFVSPLLFFLLVPITVVVAISLWKL